MVNIMTTKSLKKFTELLNRSEGISIIPIIVVMVMVSIMGGVFTSMMGKWKTSAPITINSKKAYCQAETAATFALEDAYLRFNGGNFNVGTSTAAPYVVSSVTTGNVTEVADYWFEMPGLSDDVTTGVNDDIVDDDLDDISSPDRHTIIATGSVIIGGTTVAKRQIKVLADITDNSAAAIEPGIHTDGCIQGTGAATTHFDMDNPTTTANVTYDKTCNVPVTGSETTPPIVYRPAKIMDENVFKAMAEDQGQYHSGNFSAPDNYPNSSYYYSGSVPNFIYIEGDFTLGGNDTVYGVYWINGTTTVFNGNYQINGIIISEGDITMNGGGTQVPNMNGGIIQYGGGSTLNGNGAPVDIDINEGFFMDLDAALNIVNVVSWQEAVSAN